MAWLRIDDTVPGHHKMLKAGPAACWVWICGIAYCQRHLTDGFISDAALPMLGVPGLARVTKLCNELVRVGLFERSNEASGYLVHDYHDHNRTRAETVASRDELRLLRSQAGKRGGIASGIARSKQRSKGQANARSKTNLPTRPDRTKNPPTPHATARGAGRLTRQERKAAEHVKRLRFGKCVHEPACPNHEACLHVIAAELREKAHAAR